MSGYPQDLLQSVRPAIDSEPVKGVIDWIMLYCSLDDIYLAGGQLKVLDAVMDFYGKGLFVGREVAEVVHEYHHLPGLYCTV